VRLPWKKEKRSAASLILGINSPGVVIPDGYHRLTDAPEVAAAKWRIADLISSCPIHLMENTSSGDVRVRDALARKVDYDPYSLGTRKSLMFWLVDAILDKEAFLLPVTRNGYLLDLVPMPGAWTERPEDMDGYLVHWNEQTFTNQDVLHFPLHSDPRYPWKGMGPRVQLQQIVDSIMQTQETKKAYMSTEYKPPLIVSVDSDVDALASEAGREAFATKYLATKPGQPWIIPGGMISVHQTKPLSLTDLAVKDGVELDKKAVASIYGVPGFMVGVGSYNRDEYNTFVSTVLLPICRVIEQELTKKLLLSDVRYFRINVRNLYSYTLQEMANIGDEQYVRGLMTGNEVRNWLDLPPRDGLDELVMLENYIPAGMIGDQKKLIQEASNETET